MKNIILRHNRILLAMALLFSALLTGGATLAQAHDGYQNRNGYYRDGGGYHRYGYHNHHHGYWRQQNGVRLFINVG